MSFKTVLSLLGSLLGAALIISLLGGFSASPGPEPSLIRTEKHDLRAVPLTHGLEHPWGMAFLPEGGILISERPGRLRIFQNNQLSQPVAGLPEIARQGQGGLLDVALHPQFSSNQLVYFTFAEPGSGGVGTAVGRARLDGQQLSDLEIIFRMAPKSTTGRHFGSRLVFDRQGYLYITLGDRGDKQRAQQPDDHAGSVIRLHADGRIPADNPFVNRPGWKGEKFDLGHRNMQGAALHPQTGELWTHEHGPQGGDEINIIRPGSNYGWPVITYGVNYGIGTKIGEGTHKPGMVQPIHYWVPSIAPSGMTFYQGDRFPRWQGNLLIGALKDQLLVRLELDGEKVVAEERFLQNKLGRIRDVREGPDGYIYLLTDEANGGLYRLEPAS